MKYKPGSAWKRANWDKWSFWRKIRHVVAVIISLLTCGLMFIATAWVVLVVFGLQGFLIKLRDTILLDLMHTIFG